MQLLPRIFDGIIGYAPKSIGAYAVDYFQSLSATEYDTITYSGTEYKVYHTFKIPWCGTQAGNVKPIQLTKKIKLYADHYASKPAGVVNAKQWAISNGFDVEGIENLADLDFYVGEETSLSAYPYLMDEKTLDKLGGFSNFLAYVQSQSSEYVIPVVMADLYSFYTRAGTGVNLLPEEIRTAPAISSEPLPLHAGDSGKPVFLTVEDYGGNRKDILLTHIYQLTNGWGTVPVQGFGSNLIKAFEIIKAFCEAQNETLNIFEVNSMTTDNMTKLCLNGKEVKELYVMDKLAYSINN